jgi:hypothetical protein
LKQISILAAIAIVAILLVVPSFESQATASPKVTTLAESSGYALNLFVYDGYAYWVSYAKSSPNVLAIDKVPISGGKVAQIYSGPTSSSSFNLVVEGDFIYFSNGSAIYRISIDGGGAKYIAQCSCGSVYYGTGSYSATSAYVYYVYNQNIQRVSISGGTPTVLYTDSEANSIPQALTVYNSYIYWVNGNSGAIGKIPIAGGKNLMLDSSICNYANNGNSIPRILVENGYVYWAFYCATANEYYLDKVPTTGGAVTTLNDSYAGSINGFAINATGSLFYSDNSYAYKTDGIYYLPSSGGTPTLVARLFDADAVFAYSGRIYFTGSNYVKVFTP